jgi:hypothetical protein
LETITESFIVKPYRMRVGRGVTRSLGFDVVPVVDQISFVHEEAL